MDFQIIDKYFSGLTPHQLEQFRALSELYSEWNEKINVISRRDIDNLYSRHVLHSLAIAKFLGDLREGTTILDLGTGGGFPGIPLAIAYPECRFHLIDRIGKKLKVVQAVADAIGLKNITIQHGDIGECHERYDYVVSRAVMRLDALVKLIGKNISRTNKNHYSNGLVCLKGGDISDESEAVRFPVVEYDLKEFFNEDFFDTKKLVYVPMNK